MAYDLVIQQGSTFTQTFRWEDSSIDFRDIVSISATAPVTLVTSTAHGLTDGWRVAVVGCKGNALLNAQNSPPKAKDYFQIQVVDPTTIRFPGVNGKNQGTYTTLTGVIQFAPSVDLAGYTARMQIRQDVNSDPPLYELTTENGGITVDPVAQTITLNITALQTSGFTWNNAVYSLEMVNVTASTVTQLLTGKVSVLAEVTR